MILRLANSADVPALLKLLRAAVPLMQAMGNFQWDETYPNETVYGNDIAKGQLWVADVDGQLAGIAAITTEQDAEYAVVGWDLTEPAIVTHRLAVDPAFRGRGIGKALLEQAERIARQRGIAVLRIDTSAENNVTQRLFPQLGYVYAGETSFGFRPGLRVYCYEKRL